MSTIDLGRCGRYELHEPIGSGGMGTVYRGLDPELGRAVAVKIIHGWELTEDSLERFRREARTLALLSHPGIVAVYDVSMAGDDPFIVMELVDGQSVASAIAERTVTSFETKIRMMAQVCDALAYAHEAGIIHRDVKPANILITRAGQPKLADFGIAHLNGSTLTATTSVLGSPAYLAPEACEAGETDARVDVYAAAVCLYEWLCGARPFEAENVLALLGKIREQAPPLLSDRWIDCPPSLERCVHKGLARNPDDRYQRAADFAHALREIAGETRAVPLPPVAVQTPQQGSRSHRVLFGVFSLIVVTIVVAWLLWSWRHATVPPAPTSAALIEAPPPAAPPRPVPKTGIRPAPTAAGRGASSPASGAGATRSASPAAPAAPAPGDEDPNSEAAPPPALPIGTIVRVRLLTELSSDRAQPGHGFDAALAEPLLWNHVVVAAAGTPIRGLVDEVQPGIGDRPPSLRLSLTEITLGGKPARIRTGRYDVTAPADASGRGSITTLLIGAATSAVTANAVGPTALPRGPEETKPGTVVLRQALTFKLAAPLLLDNPPH